MRDLKFVSVLLPMLMTLSLGPRVYAQPQRDPNKISVIQIRSDGDVDSAMVTHLFELKEGQSYSASRVEEGLVRLAELGRFKAVDSAFDRGSGTLTIELSIIETLAGVDVSSSQQKDIESLEADVSEVLGVSVGDPIYVDLFDEIRTRITSRLFDRGYLQAKVALALEQKDRSSSRRLLVSLELGPRTQIRNFKLNGFSGSDIRELFAVLRSQNELEQFVSSLKVEEALQVGKKAITHSVGIQKRHETGNFEVPFELPLDWISLASSLSKWAANARQNGFYDFSAKASPIPTNIAENVVDVQINLDRGVQYDVQMENNVVFWERQLRSSIVDRTLRLGVPFNLADADFIMRRMYESYGYKDVKIEVSIEGKKEIKKIIFRVKEGKQFYVGNISLEGVSDTELLDLDQVTRDWLKALESPLHRTYYDESLLKSRTPELLRLIRMKGFVQARILEFRPDVSTQGRNVDVEISLQLGPKYFIRNVAVTGNKVLSEAELDQIVVFEPGKVIDPTKLEEISQNLVRKYQDLGFPNVRVVDDEKAVFKIQPGSNEVDVELKIDTGPQISIGNIYVQGLKRAKNEVVLRELREAGVRPKQIWNAASMNRAEQRLVSLGIFGAARFESSGGRILERAEDENAVEKQERDLRVDITERNAGAFEFGPGYRTDLGVVGFAEFNYRNLSGLNRGVVLRAQVSRKLQDFVDYEQKYSATFLEPYIYGDPTRIRFNVNYSLDDQYVFEKGERKNGFLKSEFSLGVGAERELLPNFRITQNLFTFSLPRIIDPIGTDYQVEADKSYRIGTMGTILTYDSRDNLFNPTSGLVSALNVEYSSPRILSDQDAHFVIARLNFANYLPLNTGVVFAASLSFARLHGLGKTSGIPENKRLSLGGLSSIRSINEGGLLSEPGALVRQQSFEGKFELRQSLFADFGFAYFFDIGKIWALRYLGGQAPSDTGWRSGLGFGLRYNTIVGPISADFVYNPDPKEGLGNETFKFQLSIGTF